MLKFAPFVLLSATLFIACSSQQQNQVQQPTGVSMVNYAPKVGIAVSTSARTCMAIQNSTLTDGSPVTLVNPAVPQSFIPAQVTGQSADPCPIAQQPDPAWNNYTISSSQGGIPKNTALIAVVGSPNGFTINNNFVQADLDQNQKIDTFRACGASDGVHLSVWSGASLSGTVLWRGYYYESGNPGTLPTCTPAETSAR